MCCLKLYIAHVNLIILSPDNWDGNEPLPGCEDVCASFQRAVTAHLVTRTHRAMLYIRRAGLDVHHLVRHSSNSSLLLTIVALYYRLFQEGSLGTITLEVN